MYNKDSMTGLIATIMKRGKRKKPQQLSRKYWSVKKRSSRALQQHSFWGTENIKRWYDQRKNKSARWLTEMIWNIPEINPQRASNIRRNVFKEQNRRSHKFEL